MTSRSQEPIRDLDDAPGVLRGLLDANLTAVPRQVDLRVGAAAFLTPTSIDAIEADSVAADDLPPPVSAENRPIALAARSRAGQTRPPEVISLLPVGLDREKRVQRRVKRAIDITIALAVLVAIAPLMGLIAIAIKLDSPGPVIYRQQRAAERGRLFTMYKFRSMRQDADDLMPSYAQFNEQRGPVFKIRDDPRKTRVGRLLRRLSLDEVPQLINVLFGDLSLVGPRPPLASELDAYESWHWQRLAMPQGLTGLWQVSGRSLLDFDQMLALDMEYITSWSLMADIRILLRTVPTVISGRGAF